MSLLIKDVVFYLSCKFFLQRFLFGFKYLHNDSINLGPNFFYKLSFPFFRNTFAILLCFLPKVICQTIQKLSKIFDFFPIFLKLHTCNFFNLTKNLLT